MALARKKYRGNKVWAEVDEQGRLVEERGLVKIRYRQDSEETYSARVAEISEIPEAGPVASTSGNAPAAETHGSPEGATGGAGAKRAKRGGAGRAKGSSKGAMAARSGAANRDVLIVHTDGSCFGNPGPAGIGVTLDWKGHVKEISRYLGEATNNIAELTAIKVALEEVKNRGVPVRIHTDSAYSIGVLSEGWKVKENRELVASIQALMREFGDLEFVKVRGHSGHPENERVDQLARDAISRRA
jgi:ribonuclease HI